MLPATFVPTQKGILLPCRLLQLGKDPMLVAVRDATAVSLDLDATACLKLVWYRDDIPLDWSQITAAPVKHLVDAMRWGHDCDRIACNCGKWHATEEQSPLLLSVWDRQWLTAHLEKCQPAKAYSFQIMARVPKPAVAFLHRATGQDGFYLEPRLSHGRTPDRAYTAIWLPGESLSKLQALRAADDAILALTRSGQRLGLRCRLPDAQRLWQAHRPGEQWVNPTTRGVYTVGPLPRGVSRSILTKIAAELKWAARPLKPLRTTSEGITWTFLADSVPGQDCIQVEDRLVTIAKQDTNPRPQPSVTKLVAPKATQAFLQAGTKPGSDPLQLSDPWAKARAITPAPVASALTALAANATAGNEPRLTALEAKFAKLEQAQQADSATLQSVRTDLGQLQTQVDQGFTHVEHQLLQQLGTMQTAMTQSVADQIATQMQSFEALIKRQRVDS